MTKRTVERLLEEAKRERGDTETVVNRIKIVGFHTADDPDVDPVVYDLTGEDENDDA